MSIYTAMNRDVRKFSVNNCPTCDHLLLTGSDMGKKVLLCLEHGIVTEDGQHPPRKTGGGGVGAGQIVIVRSVEEALQAMEGE
jgi:hypothetical protein